jgi:hypothetical protein
MMDVSSTGMKVVKEAETCDREYVGNIRKYRKNYILLYFNPYPANVEYRESS